MRTTPPESYNDLYGNPPMLGRIEADWLPLVNVLSNPENEDSIVRVTCRYDVVPVYGFVRAPAPYARLAHNDIWFNVGDGYMHSSYVIPVREAFQTPEAVPEDGFWGEVSVPFVQLRPWPGSSQRGVYRLAYNSVHKVVERVDVDGVAWYRLLDDVFAYAWWVEARSIRRLSERDLSPISPEVPPDHKRIEISISAETMTCFEYDLPVIKFKTATGRGYINAKGEQFGFRTPVGEHRVIHKRPTRHMTGGDPESATNRFDLPGVPWCTYFSQMGAAIHGAYWHNDFGIPRSHGCVNLTADAAKWIYRWTTPYNGSVISRWATDSEPLEHPTQVIVVE
jgi:hypothetical protein